MHIAARSFAVYDEFLCNPYFVSIIVQAIKSPIQAWKKNHNMSHCVSIIKQVEWNKAVAGVCECMFAHSGSTA